jgi:hypothetical protein
MTIVWQHFGRVSLVHAAIGKLSQRMEIALAASLVWVAGILRRLLYRHSGCAKDILALEVFVAV